MMIGHPDKGFHAQSISNFKYEQPLTELAKVCFTYFNSCDHTLGKFKYCLTFCTHGTTLHGAKYVGEIKRYFIKRLIT